MFKRFFDVVIALIITVSSLSLPCVAEGDAAVLADSWALSLYPADGSVMNDIPGYFSADMSQCESVTFILDDKVLGKASDDGRLALDKIAYGKHTLRAVAVLNDGTSMSEVSRFEIKPKLISKSFSESFDTYNPSGEPNGFYVWDQSKIIERAAVPGPSGEEGDKALSLSITTDNAVSWVGTYLHCSKFSNYNNDTVVFEFDIKPHSATDSILFNNAYLWSGSFNLINSGKWLGTEIEATTEWHHVKIVSDTVNKKISFILDGEVIKDNVAYASYSNFANTHFRLSPNQTAKADGEQHGGFSLDNVNFYNYTSYDGVKKLAYTQGGNEYETEYTIPSSADTIKIYVDMSVQVDSSVLTKPPFTLSTTDGQNIAIGNVDYNEYEGSVTITPSKPFPSGREFVLSTSDEIMFTTGAPLGGVYEVRFETLGKGVDTQAQITTDGNPLWISDQILVGTVVGADITATNISGQNEEITYIIAIYKEDRIISLNAKTLKPTVGDPQCISLTLPPISEDGEYEVCLMTCTNFDDIRAVSQYAVIK